MPERGHRSRSTRTSASTRRALLARVAGVGVVAAADAAGLVAGRRPGAGPTGPRDQSDRFDPTVHGFGFPNWWGERGCSVLAEDCPEGRAFTVEYEPVAREAVRAAVSGGWVVDPTVETTELLVRLVHSLAVRQLATNGHCYGMTLAAEDYRRDPASLPAARESASDVPRPTGSYEPVGRRIRAFHADQLLDSAALWLSLLALDLGRANAVASVELATAAIDETGTAVLMFGGLADGHQVLAYDYEAGDDGVRFALYDPELPADEYGARPYEEPASTITVDADTGSLAETIYGYEAWIYNDVDPDLDLLDRLTGGVAELLARLERAVWVSTGAGASLEVGAPDDATVLQFGGSDEAAAPAGAAVPGDAVLVLDADPADYEIDVVADAGEYSLEVFGVHDGEVVVDEAVTDRVNDSASRFVLAVEDAGAATLQRVESDVAGDGAGDRTNRLAVVGAGAGATVGLGLGYRYLARSREDGGD